MYLYLFVFIPLLFLSHCAAQEIQVLLPAHSPSCAFFRQIVCGNTASIHRHLSWIVNACEPLLLLTTSLMATIPPLTWGICQLSLISRSRNNLAATYRSVPILQIIGTDPLLSPGTLFIYISNTVHFTQVTLAQQPLLALLVQKAVISVTSFTRIQNAHPKHVPSHCRTWDIQ